MAFRTDLSQAILKTEYNEKVDELCKDAMILSFHKYGPVAKNYATGNVDSIKCLEQRLALYKETGNTSWLIDVINQARIEFTYPQHSNKHYRGTTSSESPGLKGLTVKDIEKLQNE